MPSVDAPPAVRPDPPRSPDPIAGECRCPLPPCHRTGCIVGVLEGVARW